MEKVGKDSGTNSMPKQILCLQFRKLINTSVNMYLR